MHWCPRVVRLFEKKGRWRNSLRTQIAHLTFDRLYKVIKIRSLLIICICMYTFPFRIAFHSTKFRLKWIHHVFDVPKGQGDRDFIINGYFAPTRLMFKYDVECILMAYNHHTLLILFDHRDLSDARKIGLKNGYLKGIKVPLVIVILVSDTFILCLLLF